MSNSHYSPKTSDSPKTSGEADEAAIQQPQARQHEHALFDPPPGRQAGLLETQLHAPAIPHFTNILHFSPSTALYTARLNAFYNAIALQLIRLFQSHCIFFSTTRPCRYIYSYVFTPGLHRIDMGVF